MAKIRIKGDTSGYVDLQAPDVAGAGSITVPNLSGTLLTSASDSSDFPSAILTSTSDITPSASPVFDMRGINTDQDISAETWNKVTMNTSTVDTNSMIDLTNNRVTPTVAGYYAVSGMIRINFDTLTQIVLVGIRKNGSEVAAVQYQLGSDNIQNGQYPIHTTIVQCNGTTDYIELYGYVGDAATFSDITTTSQSSILSGFLVRAT